MRIRGERKKRTSSTASGGRRFWDDRSTASGLSYFCFSPRHNVFFLYTQDTPDRTLSLPSTHKLSRRSKTGRDNGGDANRSTRLIGFSNCVPAAKSDMGNIISGIPGLSYSCFCSDAAASSRFFLFSWQSGEGKGKKERRLQAMYEQPVRVWSSTAQTAESRGLGGNHKILGILFDFLSLFLPFVRPSLWIRADYWA
ncbi:hypothetical protein M440DRAFT_1102480 [Trichoderma longibrachiatum ATCC 18648]|uniref:Uncharacterized protein n=1 Tax=Trichoderma longibrachiatum ATCC 18648 TaxID=983965 RepID=A0A2T4BRL8_TRILO|nr:hypothetical protein M440DRAFT_1102480 [Trichoderma longibrachiatum ATCC 18648]